MRRRASSPCTGPTEQVAVHDRAIVEDQFGREQVAEHARRRHQQHPVRGPDVTHDDPLHDHDGGDYVGFHASAWPHVELFDLQPRSHEIAVDAEIAVYRAPPFEPGAFADHGVGGEIQAHLPQG